MVGLTELSKRVTEIGEFLTAGASENASATLIQAMATEQKRHNESQTAMIKKILDLQQEHTRQIQAIIARGAPGDNSGKAPDPLLGVLLT